MNKQITITFNDGSSNSYPAGVTLLELSKYYKNKMPNPIIGAKINNVIKPLSEKIYKDITVTFIDFTDIDGYRMHIAGLKYVAEVAAKELWGAKTEAFFLNSLDKAIYTEIKSDHELTSNDFISLKNKMQEIIDMDLVFEITLAEKKDAINYLKQNNEPEKAYNIACIPNRIITLYKLKNYFNYFYANMPYSTGVLKSFDISFVSANRCVLRYPTNTEGKIIEFKLFPKTLQVFDEYRNWMSYSNLRYVSDINKIVSENKIKKYILANTMIGNDIIMNITKEIVAKKDQVKLLLIAGPSSSGKTTSSKKLQVFLQAFGVKSHVISVDDYYKERSEAFIDDDGEYNFDCIEAVDLELLNQDLKKILAGEETIIPTFNFFTGKKEFNGNAIRLLPGEMLILEGLHCLNDQLTSEVNNDQKYKIYVSPFTALNIDRHNYVSTVDLRLIRRIVRDDVFRGFNVADTIRIWQKVRAAEEKFVFPYQDEANAILNTAAIYELGVLKVYAEPLLYSVPIDSPYYEEARRLLGFLRTFFTISPELVPNDSVIREFIGGSIYANN